MNLKINKQLDFKLFKSQISFAIEVHKNLRSHQRKVVIDKTGIENFINSEECFLQHRDLHQELKNGKDAIILELPPFSGKTTGALLASLYKSYTENGISLIIYPSKEAAMTAFEYMKGILKSDGFLDEEERGFELVTIYNDDYPYPYEYLYYPNIIITDVFSLHKDMIININIQEFWQNINLIVLEDFNNYNNVFGLNCSFLFRRLFSKITSYCVEPKENTIGFTILGTTTILQDRAEFFSELVSIPEIKISTITSNSQKPVNHYFSHWFLPFIEIESHAFEARSEPTFTKNEYFREFDNVVGTFLHDSLHKILVILWQNSIVTKDNITNLFYQFDQYQEAQIYVGSSLERIRLQLIDDHLDWDSVDIVIIMGSMKPFSYYLEDLKYIGKEHSYMILYHPQVPYIQHQIFHSIYNDGLHERNFPLKNSLLMNSDQFKQLRKTHLEYLEEEVDISISKKMIMGFFPKGFFEKGDEQVQSLWMYLAENIKKIPHSPRTEENLKISHTGAEYSIEYNSESIGKIEINHLFPYVFKGAKIIRNGNRFIITRINNKKIYVQKLDQEIFTYKIANYEIIEEKKLLHEFSVFNDQIVVRSLLAKVSEKIIAKRTVDNFIDNDESRIINPVKFESRDLNVIELDLSRVLDEESPENILHSLTHLVIESIRIIIPVNVEEIAINYIVNGEKHVPVRKIQIFDLTGLNKNVWEYLNQDIAYEDIFTRAWQLLYDCPCNEGCNSCIKINYCNIENCSDKLDKMRTFNFLSRILEREVNLYESWKRITENVDPTRTGIRNVHTNKLTEMENLAIQLMQKRHQLVYPDESQYNSSFMSYDEINRLQEIYGTNFHVYGYTTNDQIVYIPGLPEYILYTTIFHERFHNYQNIQPGASNLRKFNWENIDDETNIPFAGNLLVEGSAVWFSLRAMEIFCNINFSNNIISQYINEYIAGVMLMLEIEKKYGFLGAIKNIFSPDFNYRKKELRDSYDDEIQRQVNTYLSTRHEESLLCIQNNNQLSNSNRLSYFLLSYFRSDIIYSRIRQIANENPDDTNNIIGLAMQRAHNQTDDMTIINNMEERARLQYCHFLRLTTNQESYLRSNMTIGNQIMNLFREMGLVNQQDDFRLYCCRCSTNCTLFDACMINGGERFFREICNLNYNKGIFKTSNQK